MSTLVCQCQAPIFPPPQQINAGLPESFFRPVRALGTFPGWRQSMLQAIGRRPSLDAWRARGPRDLGLMWVDMSAYVADVVSFYDALISAETYLGTASLPGSRRSLVGLLGYRGRRAARQG